MPYLTIEELVDRRFTNLEKWYGKEERKQARREASIAPTSKKAKAKRKRIRKGKVV